MGEPSRNHTLRTLGRLTLTDASGREEPSLSTRPRKLALLAWLAMRPERRATREQLVGVFWGDRDEGRARNSLSDAISHLRRVLGRDAIVAQGSDVALAGRARLGVDAVELVSGAARSNHALVVELYRGPFLDGFYIDDAPEFDAWRDRERARLARVFAKSAAVRCAELANDGAWDECRDVADRWLDVEPASAGAALMLLRAIAAPETYAAHAAVRSSYESLVARLDDELGIAPAPEVRAFAKEVAGRLSEAPDPPIVGTAAPVASVDESVIATVNSAAATPEAVGDPPRTHAWGPRAAVAAVAITVVAIGVAAARRPPRLDQHRVIVAAFQNQTGDNAFTPLGTIAADWVSRGLVDSHAVEVADPMLNARELASADPRSIGRRARAGIVVVGSYVRVGDSVAMSARLVDANTGRVLRTTEPAMAPVTRPVLAVGATRERVFGALAAEVDPLITTAARGSEQPPTYEAYLAWVDGLDRFARRDYAAAIAPLLHAAALDSTFVSPRIWAMAAYGNIGDPYHADSILRTLWPSRTRLGAVDRGLIEIWDGELRGDRAAEYVAAHEMLAGAPGSELSWFIAGLAALAANRPNEAASLLDRIPVGDSTVVWDVYGTELADALHIAGRHDEERRETLRRLRHVPGSMTALEDDGRALAALGDARGAADVATRILGSGRDPTVSPGSAAFDIGDELLVHGYAAEARLVFGRVIEWQRALPPKQANTRRGTLVLVGALTRYGDLERADSLSRSALARAPRDWQLLKWHGVIAALRGDAAEARRASESLANLRTPYLLGANTLARAEVAAVLEERAEATRLLRQAIAEGETPMVLHATPELVVLRGYAPYEELVKPAG